MIKISWGTKIAVLYITFVGLIVMMVVMSFHQKLELVSEDYYEKELAFQHKLDETKNAEALQDSITHNITNTDINLQFQSQFKTKKITGEILFFRPSDASKDYKTAIALNADAQQKISLKNFSKGMYKMQISYKDEQTPYFTEQTIVIP